jgi:hypothetical protein
MPILSGLEQIQTNVCIGPAERAGYNAPQLKPGNLGFTRQDLKYRKSLK